MARTLEKPAARSGAARKPSTRSTKTHTKMVIANPSTGEEWRRVGMQLVGAGLSAAAIGVLEGRARKGKAEWWRKLTPKSRALILFAVAAGGQFLARHLRKQGKPGAACSVEAASVGAFTLAVAYLVEGGHEKEAMAGLGALDELAAYDQLDEQIDRDIKGAVQKLNDLADKIEGGELDGEDLEGLVTVDYPAYEPDALAGILGADDDAYDFED